jgi:hypothetical protein
VYASVIPKLTTSHKKAKQIAERMQVDNFVASDCWLCHDLVYKKVPGESATVNTNTSDEVTGRI